MIKCFKQRKLNARRALVNEIANRTYDLLSASNGWEKFLPPVSLDGVIYMVTENGSIYRLTRDHAAQMEQITQIRRM